MSLWPMHRAFTNTPWNNWVDLNCEVCDEIRSNRQFPDLDIAIRYLNEPDFNPILGLFNNVMAKAPKSEIAIPFSYITSSGAMYEALLLRPSLRSVLAKDKCNNSRFVNNTYV